MTPVAELFECPECGNDTLEEVEVGVIVTTPVSEIGPDHDIDYDYNLQTMDGGWGYEIDCYQCVQCGWKLPQDLDDGGGLWDILTSPDSPCKPKEKPNDGVDGTAGTSVL